MTFLDQFIGRGAASDVRNLRVRLETSADSRRLLKDQLPSNQSSERQAFDAMRAFFEIEHDASETQPGEHPDLADLISWTRRESATERGHFDDAGSLQMTGDPAQWHDWLRSVRRVTSTS